MTRSRLKPQENAASTAAVPTREEFQAECEALTAAVMQVLEADLESKIQPPANNKFADAVSAEPCLDQTLEAINFIPPYSCFKQGPGEVAVSRRLLEFLLRCVLVHVEFDEEQYQTCNPDVAAAIEWNSITSGREHFVKEGYFEGRSGGVCVDETWYLARNPDVAAARGAGKFESAAAQYRLSGASEWRVPNPRLEGAIRMWKDILAE